ncbi:TM2 domain-containing protein [Paracoccus alkenifer]|uniref:TM2 domain-containing protein n=1 Tax=Paracoccus alkenifer TaxID=65735 RepID=A0A1H6LNP9_9RHOB|nr:TM2 domain-containing protein [Paracoccus alkenifer]
MSNDAIAMMKFQSRAKSTGMAYLLWFFLGGLGAQRFYVGSAWVGALVALCTISGFVLLFPFIITAAVSIFDLFTLPSQVRKRNAALMAEISQGGGL